MQDWTQAVDWGGKLLISGICTYGVSILKDLKGSVDELNKSVATLIERTVGHSRDLEKLDARVRMLEIRHE